MITLSVNGQEISVAEGSTVATAIFQAAGTGFHRSVTGEPRFPICGMGICFECRVTVNGTPHQRSCQVLAENGMVVQTDE